MASDLEIDRQVLHLAMNELEMSISRLEDGRRAVRHLEEASFGSSELGLRTQAQTEAADDAVRLTVVQLRQVHDDLVAALRTMQAQADAADTAALEQTEQLARATAAVAGPGGTGAGA